MEYEALDIKLMNKFCDDKGFDEKEILENLSNEEIKNVIDKMEIYVKVNKELIKLCKDSLEENMPEQLTNYINLIIIKAQKNIKNTKKLMDKIKSNKEI